MKKRQTFTKSKIFNNLDLKSIYGFRSLFLPVFGKGVGKTKSLPYKIYFQSSPPRTHKLHRSDRIIIATAANNNATPPLQALQGSASSCKALHVLQGTASPCKALQAPARQKNKPCLTR